MILPGETKLLIHLAQRVVVRRWTQQKLKTLALLLVVALGVSVFLSIGLTNRAAINSFSSFTGVVAGESQYYVRSTIGSLDLADARSVRTALIKTEASLFPTLEMMASVEMAESQENYKLIGVDFLASASHLYRTSQANRELQGSRIENMGVFDYLAQGNSLFAPSSVASRHQWQAGDDILFNLGSEQIEFRYSGEIPLIASDANSELPLLVMDLYALARLADRVGQIDRIDITLPSELRTQSYLEKVSNLLEQANPGNWVIESNAERIKTGSAMTLALRSNLRALSALSLLIAFLLVFQALDSSVSQRREEIASLRSLGVTVRQIRLLWLLEAAVIGALGGVAGIALASLTARFFSGMVNETVNALYYFTADDTLDYAYGEIGLAWVTAIAASILAGWFPARAASLTPPAQLLKKNALLGQARRAIFGKIAVLTGVLGAAAYFLPPLPAPNGHGAPIGGYISALAANACAISIGCFAMESLPLCLAPLARRYKSFLIGLSRFRKPVARHRLALGSVTVAVGMTAAMVVLIGSFEKTVTSWLEQVIHADVYVRSKQSQSAEAKNAISKEIAQAITSETQVEDSATISRFSINIYGLDTFINGYDTDYLIRKPHLSWIGSPPDNLESMKTGESAIISESFQERFNVGIGDSIDISTVLGEKTLRIIGIQSDFGNESGSLGVDQIVLEKWTARDDAQGIALHLKSDVDLEAFVSDLETRYPALEISPNRVLKDQATAIFHQTFAITYALEGVGLFISVIGLGAMLFSLTLERRVEISALLRLGMSRASLASVGITEALALSALGIVLGIMLGLVQGWILIYVVNKQAFGWTLSLSIPWNSLLLLGFATLLAGLFVSWRISWWSSGLPAQQEE
ncbi:MAG TPA: hypothetical protein DIV79_16575 [Opitutae bacterium]|nr:hypothetical protein [Opitutaceae bacterium]HCR31620.1 hypothetical protein [Opitutae bacterium]